MLTWTEITPAMLQAAWNHANHLFLLKLSLNHFSPCSGSCLQQLFLWCSNKDPLGPSFLLHLLILILLKGRANSSPSLIYSHFSYIMSFIHGYFMALVYNSILFLFALLSKWLELWPLRAPGDGHLCPLTWSGLFSFPCSSPGTTISPQSWWGCFIYQYKQIHFLRRLANVIFISISFSNMLSK